MAIIEPYTSRLIAQGQINTRANGEDFGAQVGQGLVNLGTGMESLSRGVYEAEAANQVTDVYKLMAQKRLEWDQQLNDRSNTADPADREFMPRIVNDMRDDLLKSGQQFTNRHAQELFARRSEELMTSIGGKAITVQSQLAAQNVRNKDVETTQLLSKAVNQDPSQFNRVADDYDAMVSDPAGSYSRVPEPVRDELKRSAKRNLGLSAVEGFIGQNLNIAAQKLLPDLYREAFTTAQKQDVVQIDQSLPAGLMNKNPFNIKYIGQKNSIGPSKNLDQGDPQARYQTMEDGLAAGFDLALRKYNSGMTTMNQIIAGNMGWTPGNKDAALNIAKFMRVGVDQDLNLNDPVMLAKFGDALAKQEQGGKAGNVISNEMMTAVALSVATGAPMPRFTATDSQGLAVPQLKINKNEALQPPQNVDIPGWNSLTLDDQQKMMAKVITLFNSNITVNRDLLGQYRRDMHANFLNGNSYTNEKQLQAQYVQAYGPEMAQRLIAEDNNTKEIGVFTGAVRGKSVSEITQIIGQPPASNATANDYDTWSKKVAVVQNDRKELESDPTAYVAKYSPAVSRIGAELALARQELAKNNTPNAQQMVVTATQKMITASMAEQRRLGVPNPQVLSAPEEKDLVRRIEDILTSGQDVAQGIASMYAMYGSYGDTVAKQIGKQIGGMVSVIGSGIDPSVANLLVEANRNKDALKKTLDHDKIKQLDDEVILQSKDLAASLSGAPNGPRELQTYQDQINMLAMLRMSKMGESQRDAVKKAYDSLVGSRYKFQDGYRVPIELDAQAVKRQADYSLRTLSPSDVMLLPGSIGNPQDRMEQQLADIRLNARWVTAAPSVNGLAQEGLVLMVPKAGGYVPVTGADGRQIFRSFGELLAQDAITNIQSSQDALARRDMKAYEEMRTRERAQQRKDEEQRIRDMVTRQKGQK